MKYKVGDKIVAWLVQSDPNAVLSGLIGLFGSVIGAAASLLAVFMSNNLQKHGKISLHARIVGSRVDKQHRTWGYRQTNQGLSFHIPLWLDICNTSNISRIVRNVNLCIVKNRTIVHEFTQFQGNGIEPQEPNTVIIGNEGAYSFVIPANSVLRAEVEFGIIKNELQPADREFDSVYLTYFDESDCLNIFFLEDIPKPQWVIGELPRPKRWKTLKKIKFGRFYKYRADK